MRTKILTFLERDRTSTEIGMPSTSHKWERMGKGERDLQFGVYGLWTETANDDERMYKEKSVTELSEYPTLLSSN